MAEQRKRTRRKQQQAPKPHHETVSSFTLRRHAKRYDQSLQVKDEGVYSLDRDMSSVKTIVPRYSIDTLRNLREQSNILQQCIAAYVTNVAMYGFRVIPLKEGVKMNSGERKVLESFIAQANVDESLTSVHSRRVSDYESYGYSMMEVIRNRRGEITLLKYMSSYRTRILAQDDVAVPVRRTILRGGKRSTVTELKKFRRYVQELNGQRVYFKEIGDTRRMDYRSGRYQDKDYKVEDSYLATEVLHHKQHAEDSYGLPRWIAQLPSILGSREAEETNLKYFEDNMVPPMILSVAGGRLTRESYNQLKQLLEEGGIGKDRQNQILLIEAVPEADSLDEKKNSVSLKVDKLADQRPSDALFSDYDDANIAKIRSSFRLPPVTVGLSQDITFATANVSAFVAETQVFLPERRNHDEFLNKRLINHPFGLNLQTVKLESRGPAITDPEQVIKSLTAVNVMGGVTPRVSVDMINETLELSLPQYPTEGDDGYEEWMDRPISLALKGVTKNTDLEQSQKTDELKQIEGDGDVGMQQPEHGQE